MCAGAAVACDSGSADAKKRIEPVYDKAGKLQLLKDDANGDGKIDVGYMDARASSASNRQGRRRQDRSVGNATVPTRSKEVRRLITRE
jgi:hypothetical protein